MENKTAFFYICVDTGVVAKHDVMQEAKKLVPMTQDATFKIGYSLLVQTLHELRFLLDPKYLSMEKKTL